MERRKKIVGVYFQPAFVICAAVLALGSLAMSRLNVKKALLPLSKSLDNLDESRLVGYKVIARQKIDNPDVLKSLGTEVYIEWVLEDTAAPVESPVRKCVLFVTYYGLPDQVPHVPEECYTGVGNQILASEGVTFKVEKGEGTEKLAGRCLMFLGASSRDLWSDVKFPVLYVFSVDGVYAGRREEVRWTLNRHMLFKQVYFSKVEWKLFNTRLGQSIYPSKEEAVNASGKLLTTVLPILEKEHWPAWPVVKSD